MLGVFLERSLLQVYVNVAGLPLATFVGRRLYYYLSTKLSLTKLNYIKALWANNEVLWANIEELYSNTEEYRADTGAFYDVSLIYGRNSH